MLKITQRWYSLCKKGWEIGKHICISQQCTWKHRKNKLEIIGNAYFYDMGEKEKIQKYRMGNDDSLKSILNNPTFTTKL